MFGIFKNSKKPLSSAPIPSEKKAKRMTNNEVLVTINQLQKELDKLKLTITGGVEHEVRHAGRVTDKALEDLRGRSEAVQKNEQEKVVEGVFDGQKMIGADGQQYDVPANYASKSKLVEGDILKLTINNLGAFIYKQIKPIERERMVGVLEQDEQNLQYYAVAEGKKWKLLTASVTYYHGEPGDEVVFLIPGGAGSRWAAVENIIQ